MKKAALLAVLVLALGGVRLEAGVERVRKGTDLKSLFDFGESGEGDACTRIHFRAAYENPIGGFFTCEGFRLVTKDTEQCTITDLSSFPPGIYRGVPDFVVDGLSYTWFSDYDGVTAAKIYLIVSDNGDGTGHLYVDAHY